MKKCGSTKVGGGSAIPSHPHRKNRGRFGSWLWNRALDKENPENHTRKSGRGGCVRGNDQRSPSQVLRCQHMFRSMSGRSVTLQRLIRRNLLHSTFQWFQRPCACVGVLLRGFAAQGKMGIQAPARNVYSPNFLDVLGRVHADPHLRAEFESFEVPWLFLDSVEEYRKLFEMPVLRSFTQPSSVW